jgi:rod shape-determining protein MreC
MLKKKIKKIIYIIAVVGLLIFFHFSGILKPLENIILKILNPVLSGAYSISTGIRSKYNEQSSKINLNEKIKQLEMEIAQLTEKNAKLEIIEEENKTLRKDLSFLSQNKYKYVMSNIVSRGDLSDTADRTETIYIDKGLSEGITPGLAVVSGQGLIIGKIIEVKDNISKVYLTNNPKCKLAAAVLNETKTSGVTEGELGLTVKMSFVPQAETIKVGDIIVTSGLEKMIPRGLVIGKVAEVKKESNELWQTAMVEQLANPDNLIIVSVLLPS